MTATMQKANTLPNFVLPTCKLTDEVCKPLRSSVFEVSLLLPEGEYQLMRKYSDFERLKMGVAVPDGRPDILPALPKRNSVKAMWSASVRDKRRAELEEFLSKTLLCLPTKTTECPALAEFVGQRCIITGDQSDKSVFDKDEPSHKIAEEADNMSLSDVESSVSGNGTNPQEGGMCPDEISNKNSNKGKEERGLTNPTPRDEHGNPMDFWWMEFQQKWRQPGNATNVTQSSSSPSSTTSASSSLSSFSSSIFHDEKEGERTRDLEFADVEPGIEPRCLAFSPEEELWNSLCCASVLQSYGPAFTKDEVKKPSSRDLQSSEIEHSPEADPAPNAKLRMFFESARLQFVYAIQAASSMGNQVSKSTDSIRSSSVAQENEISKKFVTEVASKLELELVRDPVARQECNLMMF